MKFARVASYRLLTEVAIANIYSAYSLRRHLHASYASGLKVGRMTRRTMWVTWVTFLIGQVGLIHKLNYLDVTQIF